jgi:hypothetical protein
MYQISVLRDISLVGSSNRRFYGKNTSEDIRQRAQKLEWKDLPVAKRIQILEQLSEVIEQVLMDAQ